MISYSHWGMFQVVSDEEWRQLMADYEEHVWPLLQYLKAGRE
jgi:hypothetical protein